MLIRIDEHPIDLSTLTAYVSSPEAGAIATFSGLVRNHNLGREVLYLEYECYVPMALVSLRDLAQQVRQRWAVHEIALAHRLGRLEIGEASVCIAISSAHRRECLAAVQFAIDTLKATVPIWKKEFWADGSAWVEGCSHSEAP